MRRTQWLASLHYVSQSLAFERCDINRQRHEKPSFVTTRPSVKQSVIWIIVIDDMTSLAMHEDRLVYCHIFTPPAKVSVIHNAIEQREDSHPLDRLLKWMGVF